MSRQLHMRFDRTGRGDRRKTVARCALCEWSGTSRHGRVVYRLAEQHLADEHSVDVPEEVVEKAKAIFKKKDA